ncbi:hypothetical protein BHE90_006042 [Fusarium euwallaceae]|uniref:Uncharacterized protein n=1 Tax=Fusarium euwallaceae TaxID=1147111 RepID=A0A430LUM7_9HYPO|nr:hypothetical protein BHE90_006042 [Fusarium euwallaceae]
MPSRTTRDTRPSSYRAPDGVDLGAPVIAVDYEDVDALQTVLEQHEINTVISTLALHIIGVGQAQINLIKAAEKSEPTKRFVTGTWAVQPEIKWFDLLPYGFQHVASYTELEKTHLEWTAFNVGWFLEYYAMPNVETYIPQSTFVVDMANRHASIPGDGKQKMTFTYTKDVAKFVVAALDLLKWERNTYAIGDKLTWDEFVKIAEEARGGEKFTVTYDDVQKLRTGNVTELPGQAASYSYLPKESAQRLFSAFGIWVTEGIFDFPDEKLLNKQFPDIKVTTAREMLLAAWKGK